MLLLLLFIDNPEHLIFATAASVASLTIYCDGVEVAVVTLTVISHFGLFLVI